MKNHSLIAVCAVLSLTINSLAAMDLAQGPYNLFNPVPRDQMRPFFTDQTAFTLTPFTVDAGHFQAEVDIADYIYDKTRVPGATLRTDGWIFGWSTYKAGLCNSADLEVSIKAYSDITVRDITSTASTRSTGFGDTSISSKINLWGNDGGKTALAVLPYVDVPTSKGNNAYDGGFDVPFLVRLCPKADLGLMTGVTFYKNPAGDLHASFVDSVSVRAKLIDRVVGAAEFYTTVSEETGGWTAFGNVSAGYQVLRDLQVHAGFTFNIHDSLDYNPYIGFTWRY